MKKTIWQWLVFLSLGLAFLAPRKVFGAGACTCARFNDFYDCGCRKTPSVPGGPPSGAVNASGNSSYCPTCQAAHGMPQWWVDEPYINVHVMDEPLSYTTSSGQEMAFRFNYRQRFSVPGLDQVPSQIIPFQAYPNPNRIADDNYVNTMHEAAPNPGSVNAGGMTNATWSHNWMMHIVFWDWNLEASRVGYPGGVGGESYPFQRYYEAFQFDPDGGIRYFTYSYGGFGSAIAGETLNVPTQTTNSVSQAQLVMGNALYFTNRPTPDANGIYWGNGTNGLTVLYPDGSKDVFDLLNWFPLGNTTMDALLTQRIDPQGRATQLGYQAVIITNATMESTTNSYFRVRYVVDTDGRTNTFVYTNSTASPWLLTEIDDPFGRKARFAYNGSNWLSTIIDAANNTNSFAYPSSPDSGGWLQSLTTPYGTTSFSYYQLMDSGNPSNYVERVALVSEPEGAHQLFAYVHNTSILSSGIVAATKTSPTVPNLVFNDHFVFDDGTTGGAEEALYHRNSFHWDRQQFANLTGTVNSASQIGNLSQADYWKAAMKHWLAGTDGISITETLSSTRDPSPDPAGGTEGQWTWYGYTDSANAYTEATSQVGAIAQLLPDGTTQYTSFNYQFTLQFYDQGNPLPCVSSNQQTYTKSDGTVGALTTWFHYTNNNIDLYSVSNSIGQFVGMGYNTHHEVTSITNALNQVTVLGYDPSTLNLIAVTNYSGQSINLAYYSLSDSTNNAALLNTITVQPEGLTVTISNYTGALPNVVQSGGTNLATLLVTNTWDNLNRLTGILFPDGTTLSNVYTNMDLVVHKDRLGNTTHYMYDNLDHLIYVTNALNKVTAFTWCNCGSLTSIADALLTNTTDLYYDNQGRLTNVSFPDGSSVTKQYDLLGRLTNQFDGAGKSVTFVYNNQGLPTAISNINGQIMGVGYDAVNRPVTITNADGVVLTRTYDLLNRNITNTWPDTNTELFQYSTNGLIAYTNQDRQVTRFARDGSGRVLTITDNLQHSNEFSYDALDRVIGLTDGLGHNTSWSFNQYGWLTNKLNNLNASVLTNGFDANGQLTTRWMPATGITTYKWDAVGNLTNITYPNRTDAYTYDADNRLTGMADTNGADVLLSSFTYTQVGQLATESGPWTSNTLSYTYNQGHRASLSVNSQIPTINQTYGYDSAWRLQSLASLAGTFNYGYTPGSSSSLVRTVGLPNAASIVDNYDSLARLNYTALLNYWGHPLDGYAYISDSWGLRTNITRQLGLSTNIVTSFFDGIGQLTTWSGRETYGTLRQNEQLGYAFDAAGNLQYRTNGTMVQTFTVNTLNEISNVTRMGTFTVSGATPAPATSVTVNGVAAQTNGDFTFASTGNSLANGNNSFTIIAQNLYGAKATNSLTVNLPTNVVFQHDANGNMTNDGTRWFFYDAENQLTNVTSTSQWQVVFVYDGLNRRRIERDYTWTNSAWLKTNETRFLYDGTQIVQERDTNNNPVTTYTRGLDLSMSLNRAGGMGGILARTDTSGSTFFHSDANGNVTALMDGNQNIVARYEYNGAGGIINKQGAMADVNHMGVSSFYTRFGILFSPTRHYIPELQRWGSSDPAHEADGINLYEAMGNNLVNNVDPDGMAWQWWHNLWHMHGGDPTPDPNSNLALRNAAGVGVTQLTDENGNRLQPGNIVPNALAQAAGNIAMLPLGGPEEEGAYAAAEEALKALEAERATKAAKAATECKAFAPKVIKQMEKAGLPGEGARAFIPRIVKNARGDEMIQKMEITMGPKAGKVGYIDSQGNIWIKDAAHAGYPDHWDVQLNGGESYFRVGLDGTILP